MTEVEWQVAVKLFGELSAQEEVGVLHRRARMAELVVELKSHPVQLGDVGVEVDSTGHVFVLIRGSAINSSLRLYPSSGRWRIIRNNQYEVLGSSLAAELAWLYSEGES